MSSINDANPKRTCILILELNAYHTFQFEGLTYIYCYANTFLAQISRHWQFPLQYIKRVHKWNCQSWNRWVTPTSKPWKRKVKIRDKVEQQLVALPASPIPDTYWILLVIISPGVDSAWGISCYSSDALCSVVRQRQTVFILYQVVCGKAELESLQYHSYVNAGTKSDL